MPIPVSIVKKVNKMGQKEGQGRELTFLDRSKHPFSWDGEVSINNPGFQGLLEDEIAPCPHPSSELPGVLIEGADRKGITVQDDPGRD